jgi:hypothetical protein
MNSIIEIFSTHPAVLLIKIIFKMVSTHLAVLPMNTVSQDTDTGVALPYYSGVIDMVGYYTVLGQDMWYYISVFLNPCETTAR